jgi:sulfide:quinone oxidoreductase
VRGVPDVYAAGDTITFPIKQGGIATQQADAVATAIAARAGAPVRPEPFRPVLRAILLTGETPLYLRSEPAGSQTEDSVAGDELLWWPPAKISGRYLAPFLAKQLLLRSPA